MRIYRSRAFCLDGGRSVCIQNCRVASGHCARPLVESMWCRARYKFLPPLSDAPRLRSLSAVLVFLLVASCGTLPSIGPNKSQLLADTEDPKSSVFVVAVDERVAHAAQQEQNSHFPETFTKAPVLSADVLHPGDTLSLTIWENVDDGLLNVAGAQTRLEEIQIDSSGFIFVPYAGRIRAAGNTPESIRQIITRKLAEQTPDPQVEVRRLAGDGATVSLIGGISAQGIYPIERPTLRLSGMIAAGGGVAIEPEITKITVIRNKQRGEIWFEDLYKNPDFDIALRIGDRILVEEDTRTFTVLGAAGGQAQVTFRSAELNVLEAIAQVGGLSASASDPTGIFVIRDEKPEVLNKVLGRGDLKDTRRVMYTLDLTKPQELFWARGFLVQDKDTIYITEAPFAQWSKVISALTGTLGAVGSISTASSTLQGN